MVVYILTTNDEDGVTSVSAYSTPEKAIEKANAYYYDRCEEYGGGVVEESGTSFFGQVGEWSVLVSPVILQ